jgi:hypothetical protein
MVKITVEEKLDKLSASIRTRLGVASEDNSIFAQCYQISSTEKRIQACLMKDNRQKCMDEEFNDNWTLKEWKAFRDRCVEGLRGV